MSNVLRRVMITLELDLIAPESDDEALVEQARAMLEQAIPGRQILQGIEIGKPTFSIQIRRPSRN